MITVVLFDKENKPVGRAVVPATVAPGVVLWNDRAYVLYESHVSGFRYRQRDALEVPLDELRKAPGIG